MASLDISLDSHEYEQLVQKLNDALSENCMLSAQIESGNFDLATLELQEAHEELSKRHAELWEEHSALKGTLFLNNIPTAQLTQTSPTPSDTNTPILTTDQQDHKNTELIASLQAELEVLKTERDDLNTDRDTLITEQAAMTLRLDAMESERDVMNGNP